MNAVVGAKEKIPMPSSGSVWAEHDDDEIMNKIIHSFMINFWIKEQLTVKKDSKVNSYRDPGMQKRSREGKLRM